MAKAQQAQVAIVLCSTAILLAAVLGGFVLVYFQSVMIPFTIAVFMSYIIEPLVRLIMRAIGWLTASCWCGSCFMRTSRRSSR
jgi:predicted PurR-regulated permease PerM